ncbi:MAG: RHS repeat protein [Treponema sp.]|nr:RHS repeat protein [Treponema sp.]
MKASKNIILFFLFFLITFNLSAQSFNEEIYREVTVDGKIEGKWLILKSIKNYNPKGKIFFIKNNDNSFTSYDYDKNGNIIHYKTYISIDIVIENWDKYNSKNQLVESKDNEKSVWSYEYDSKGKLIKQTKTRKGKKIVELQHSYDSENKLISTVSYDFQEHTKKERIYKYDKKGRCIKEDINDDFLNAVYKYDDNDNIIYLKKYNDEEFMEYNSKNQLIHKKIVSGSKEENLWYEYVYDDKGRLEKCLVYASFLDTL